MNHVQINTEICRALGIDPKTAQKVVITLEPGHFPMIAVTRPVHPSDVDRLVTAVDVLRLVTAPDAMVPKPS